MHEAYVYYKKFGENTLREVNDEDETHGNTFLLR